MIWQIAGWLIIFATAVDLFFAVLYASHSRALFIPWVNLGIWQIFRRIAYSGGKRGAQLASLCGPLLVLLTPIFWVSLFTVGFALLYYPLLGEDIQAASGATDTSFVNALYYSGFCFSTLGLGDLEPKSEYTKMLTIIQAIAGFGALTLTLTFLQSVYTHVLEKNALGTHLHTLSSCTGEAAPLLRGALRQDTLSEFEQTFVEKLARLKEAHHAYPILQYFRFTDLDYTLPRILLLVLDFGALRQAWETLNDEQVNETSDLQRFARSLTNDLYPSLSKEAPDERLDAVALDEKIWRRRFQDAIRTLNLIGIDRGKLQRAEDCYVAARRQWAADLHGLYYSLGYHWQDIDLAVAKVAGSSPASVGKVS